MTEKVEPAVAEAGALTSSVAAVAGSTVRVSAPVIVPVTVSVAVIVREPAWRSSTDVKVFAPASPPRKV